jgi:hypothetical protein
MNLIFKDQETSKRHDDPLTGRIIGAAIEVHRRLGPGLLESTYEICLCHELNLAGLKVIRQVPVPIVYRDVKPQIVTYNGSDSSSFPLGARKNNQPYWFNMADYFQSQGASS